MIESQHTHPDGSEEITILLDPTPGAIERFDEWKAEQIAELETAGITILSFDGCTVRGYFDPTTVDPDYLQS